ncbi:MAG: phosphate transport system regulatory protein PhoU [SAR202 cluster bacterium Io17-Chloro-G9]|nr:MAG: phosphate transport system regulatory protein PhoU [SAR202 cluster bacterium Io17-Chloro-G9]
MLRADFDRSLNQLQEELLELGRMVERAIIKSMDALEQRDLTASFEVVQDDELINQQRFKLEEDSIDLIATQQPLAVDLRTLVAVLQIAVELERMGDYAEGIGKVGLIIGDEPLFKPIEELHQMSAHAIDMLRRSLQAWVERDTVAAKRVWEDDDKVDLLYDQVCRDLLSGMAEEPRTIQPATHLLWVAHDLERMADRATNIAERVIFVVTGSMASVTKETK